MSGDLIDTTEMYLKTVFELEETGIPPMRARIAERLGHSGPTVSQTVGRMERDGLLHLDDERRIHLTADGAALAMDVMRKHRLAERHLMDHIGLPYEMVHEEACRWEHVMSAEVERRIAALIDPPYVDPYGNPIPGLAELGIRIEGDDATTGESAATPGGQENTKGLALLSGALEATGTARGVVRRIGERVQSDPGLLADLAGHGVLPGAVIQAERIGRDLRLRVEGHDEVVVPDDVAGQLALTPESAG